MKNTALVVMTVLAVSSCVAMDDSAECVVGSGGLRRAPVWHMAEYVTEGTGELMMLERARPDYVFTVNDLETMKHGLRMAELVDCAAGESFDCILARGNIKALLEQLENPAATFKGSDLSLPLESMRDIINWHCNRTNRERTRPVWDMLSGAGVAVPDYVTADWLVANQAAVREVLKPLAELDPFADTRK